MKAFAVYTAGRLLVFVGIAALLYAAGLRDYLLVAAAILLSLPLSYVLLARQRVALGREVEQRLGRRRTRREDLRAKLRGDDDTAA